MVFGNNASVLRVLNLTEEKLSIEGITQANISSHLEFAEEEIEDFFKTKFSIQLDEVAYLDGKGTQYLMLPKHPIQNITEVAVDWSGTGTYTILSPAKYGWKQNGLLFLRRVALSANETLGVIGWPRGMKTVKATFDWGNSSAPKTIQELAAVIAGIKIMVALSGGKYNSFTSYTLGKLSISNSPEFAGKTIERLNAERDRLIASQGRPISAIVNA